MAGRYREELVGKRFLCVCSPGKQLQTSKLSEWPWRSGVIRAASLKDNAHKQLMVLVEFDNVDWNQREWLHIYEKDAFQVFLVEKTLVWAPRKDPYNLSRSNTLLWPALIFKSLVDIVGLSDSQKQPVEFLPDQVHHYLDHANLSLYQNGDESVQASAVDYSAVRNALRQWTAHQDGQRILATTPSVLVGFRVEVYRAEGATQWYTAVIVSYNDTSKELTLTDDTVLEGHVEDPILVQMRLIGDRVAEAILKGENVGITQRRRACTATTQHGVHYTRSVRSQSPLCQSRSGSVSAKKGGRNNARINDEIVHDKSDKISASSSSQERKRKMSDGNEHEDLQPLLAVDRMKKGSVGKRSKVEVPSESEEIVPTDLVVVKNRCEPPESVVKGNSDGDRPTDGNIVSTSMTGGDNKKSVGSVIRQPNSNPLPNMVHEVMKNIDNPDARGVMNARQLIATALDLADVGAASSNRFSDGTRKTSVLMGPVHAMETAKHSGHVMLNGSNVTTQQGWRMNCGGIQDLSHQGHATTPTSVPYSLGGYGSGSNYQMNNNPNVKMEAMTHGQSVGKCQPRGSPGTWQDRRYMEVNLTCQDDGERGKREKYQPGGGEGLEMQMRMKEERERQRAARDVHQHFEDSLRMAGQKKTSYDWQSNSAMSLKTTAVDHRLNVRPPSIKIEPRDPGIVEWNPNANLPSKSVVDLRQPVRPPIKMEQRNVERPRPQEMWDSKFPMAYPNVTMSEKWPPQPWSLVPRHRPTQRSMPPPQPCSEKPGNVSAVHVPLVSSVELPKTEPSFSLYGYQPFQHTYISQEKLKMQQGKEVMGQRVHGDERGRIMYPQSHSKPTDLTRGALVTTGTTTGYSGHVYTNARVGGATNVQPTFALIQQGLVPNPLYHSQTPPPGSNRVGATQSGVGGESPRFVHQESHLATPLDLNSRVSPKINPDGRIIELSNDSVDKRRCLEDSSPLKRMKTQEDSSPLKRMKAQEDSPRSSPIGSKGNVGSAQKVSSSSMATGGYMNSYLSFVNSSTQKVPDAALKLVTPPKNGAVGGAPFAAPLVDQPSMPTPPASQAEVETSVSPALSTSSSGSANPVTKLKKAWLQRHSDEDGFAKKAEVAVAATAVVVVPEPVACLPTPPPVEPEVDVGNGYLTDETSVMDDESTSSASETEAILAMLGKAKVKGKNLKSKVEEDVGGKQVKVVKCSEGSRESSNSENPVPQPKKRGRKPKPKSGKVECGKKLKQAQFEKQTNVGRPKLETLLQEGTCCDVAPKMTKCRECRIASNQRSKKMSNIFCRFYAFRRLRCSKNGSMTYAGFSEPRDATDEDLKLWLPQVDDPPSDLELETSKFILDQVGNQFCDLVQQEHEAQSCHSSEGKPIAWKRVVQGVREMCDVCETTLFNFHWACGKCGFVVCIDCYKARMNCEVRVAQSEEQNTTKDRDSYLWLLCNSRQPHEQEKLMLTQIVANDALWKVGQLVHSVRKKWKIASHCSCARKEVMEEEEEAKKPPSNGICKQLMTAASQCFNETKSISPCNGSIGKQDDVLAGETPNGAVGKREPSCGNYSSDAVNSPLRWLADVALNTSRKMAGEERDSKEEHFSTLRELLIRPTGGKSSSGKTNCIRTGPKKEINTLDDVINCMIEQGVNKQDDEIPRENKRLMHYMRRYPKPRSGWDPLPVRIFTLSESRLLFPDVPHTWLCEGRLLRLLDPVHANNMRLFQEQWKRGQPVLVSEVSKALDMSLWHPEAFARDFGDVKNDLVNCHTGNIVPNQPMRKFWEGFEFFSKRMQDETGEYMLLKLKDWPPGDDFSELLPSRFSDLMKSLPLPEYTHRNGRLNLAGRLPDCFVRPDLGPKMYNAYGSALYPSKGTTNLHLDISDAVNVMVYVGIPKDGDNEQHIQEALKAIDEAGCDILTRRRVREKNERPGALWHIYNARDADKIRDLLNKVADERGEKLEAHHDPIHDQSWYLDKTLRHRLYSEYGVEGYAIAQCLGDAVFIPAGAPHQVRNLHSCIKVAEDFVSPENVSHCFTLTQEFRDLSDTHTNHEDKLQVKNIIYHAVKDALAVLLANEASAPS